MQSPAARTSVCRALFPRQLLCKGWCAAFLTAEEAAGSDQAELVLRPFADCREAVAWQACAMATLKWLVLECDLIQKRP